MVPKSFISRYRAAVSRKAPRRRWGCGRHSEGLWEEVQTGAKSTHAQGREVCGAGGHHTETSAAGAWGQGSRNCRVSVGASRRGGQDHSTLGVHRAVGWGGGEVRG